MYTKKNLTIYSFAGILLLLGFGCSSPQSQTTNRPTETSTKDNVEISIEESKSNEIIQKEERSIVRNALPVSQESDKNNRKEAPVTTEPTKKEVIKEKKITQEAQSFETMQKDIQHVTPPQDEKTSTTNKSCTLNDFACLTPYITSCTSATGSWSFFEIEFAINIINEGDMCRIRHIVVSGFENTPKQQELFLNTYYDCIFTMNEVADITNYEEKAISNPFETCTGSYVDANKELMNNHEKYIN